jgi:hypothetical protein
MRELLRGLARLAFPTIALVFIIAFAPGHTGLALRIYALIAAAYALLIAVAALRRELPPARPLRPRTPRPRRQQPPETLDRLEQEVILGISSAFDLHYHLSPRLRGLARERLANRRGISLDDAPEAARNVLGDEPWALVDPQRPSPADRLARGMPPAELARVVDALERI